MAKKQYQQSNEKSMQVREPVAAYQKRRTIKSNSSGLNKAQLDFLQILRFVKTEEELNELKQIISDFYLKKLQEEADRFWDEGILGDFLLNEHLRTPYK